MSFFLFEQQCKTCKKEWQASFGIVGTSQIGNQAEVCPFCESADIENIPAAPLNPVEPKFYGKYTQTEYEALSQTEKDYLWLQSTDIESGGLFAQILNRNNACNLTVCPRCHVDDFTHVEDCFLFIPIGGC